MAKWWDELSRKEQKAYLKEHPSSKQKVSKKKKNGKKKSLDGDIKGPTKDVVPAKSEKKFDKNIELDANGNPESIKVNKPSKGTIRQVVDYVKANPGKVAMAIGAAMLSANKKYDDDVDGMDPREQSSFTKGLRAAIVAKDSKALKQFAMNTGIRTGVITVGVVALTLLTGVDLSVVIPLLAGNFWEEIVDSPNKVEYMKNAGKAYFDKVQHNLEDPEKLAEALTINEDDLAIDEEPMTDKPKKKKKNKEKAFSVMSSHETDLNKILVKVERIGVEKATTALMSGKSAQKLLDHMTMIENTIPVVASLLVASIPRKLSLANRSRLQMSQFKTAHKICVKELALMGATENFPKTPLQQVLKRSMQSGRYNFSTSYVTTPETALQPCELHTLHDVRTPSNFLSLVNIYAFKKDRNLHLATVINSDFTPKSFDVVKPGDVTQWLKTNLVI